MTNGFPCVVDNFPPESLTYFLAENALSKTVFEGLFTAPEIVISSYFPTITTISASVSYTHLTLPTNREV